MFAQNSLLALYLVLEEEKKIIPECCAYRFTCTVHPDYKPLPELIWKKGPDKDENK